MGVFGKGIRPCGSRTLRAPPTARLGLAVPALTPTPRVGLFLGDGSTLSPASLACDEPTTARSHRRALAVIRESAPLLTVRPSPAEAKRDTYGTCFLRPSPTLKAVKRLTDAKQMRAVLDVGADRMGHTPLRVIKSPRDASGRSVGMDARSRTDVPPRLPCTGRPVVARLLGVPLAWPAITAMVIKGEPVTHTRAPRSLPAASISADTPVAPPIMVPAIYME